VWHASVALLDMKHRKTRLFAQLTSGQRKLAIEFAKELLRGVGQFPSRVEHFSEYAVHYRRALTDAEVAGLPPGWMKLKAVDPAGTGIALEVDT
jgi:hypothetical protein